MTTWYGPCWQLCMEELYQFFPFTDLGEVKTWCKWCFIFCQAQIHKDKSVAESHFYLLSPPKQYFYCWVSRRHNAAPDQFSALRCLSRRKQVVSHFLPLSDQANTHSQYTYLEKFSLLMTLTFSANNIFSAVPVQVNRVHSGNRRSRTIWESIKMNWPELRFWKHCKLFPYLDKVFTLGRNTFVVVTCPLIVRHLPGNSSANLLNYDTGR